MRPNDIAWGFQPPDSGDLFVPLLRVRPGEVLRAVILDPAPLTVGVHYVPWVQRTYPHLTQECEPCRLGVGIRCRGYLAVSTLSRGHYQIAELTVSALESCPAIASSLAPNGPSLRGLILSLRRNGREPNSRVIATVDVPRGGPMECPPSFDLRRALARIWYGHDCTPPVLARDADPSLPELAPQGLPPLEEDDS